MVSIIHDDIKMMLLTWSMAIVAATVINRSTLYTVSKNIREKVAERETRRNLLKKTCFGRLIFDLPDSITFSGHIVHLLLLQQVEHEKQDEIALKLGGEFKVFGASDFKDITGLRVDGNMDLGSTGDAPSQCSLVKNVFNNKQSLTLNDVEEAYNNLDDNADDATFVRLSLIYMLEVGLLGRTKITHIDCRHLALVDNRKQFNKYPWGKLIFDLTMPSLKKGINTWEHTKSTKRPGYTVTGFPYAFQVCFT
jgi:hypothetical protein